MNVISDVADPLLIDIDDPAHQQTEMKKEKRRRGR
jgi:hypothetical protein